MYALPAMYKKFLLHFSCQGKCQNLPVSHAYFFAQNHNTLLLFLFFVLHIPAFAFHCYLAHISTSPKRLLCTGIDISVCRTYRHLRNFCLPWVLFQRASLINARKRLQIVTTAPAILKLKTVCNWFAPPAIGVLLKHFRFLVCYCLPVRRGLLPTARTQAPQLPSLSLYLLFIFSRCQKVLDNRLLL